jgi:hypothetical protein
LFFDRLRRLIWTDLDAAWFGLFRGHAFEGNVQQPVVEVCTRDVPRVSKCKGEAEGPPGDTAVQIGAGRFLLIVPADLTGNGLGVFLDRNIKVIFAKPGYGYGYGYGNAVIGFAGFFDVVGRVGAVDILFKMPSQPFKARGQLGCECR